jgi:hypothetical protein
MAANWIVVPCLLKLRDEFNAVAPPRAKGADGTIGDTAHAAGGTSDHLPDEDYPALRKKDADHVDEVHALDITTELNVPGLSLEAVVQFILGRCRSGAEKRLHYIIFNRRIWEAPGWKQQVYTGTADPHTGHAHFSASYESKLEADVSTWHLEDIEVAMTQADKDWLAAKIDAAVTAAVEKIAKYPINVTPGAKTKSMQPWSQVDAYGSPERKDIRDDIAAAKTEILAAIQAIDAPPTA